MKKTIGKAIPAVLGGVGANFVNSFAAKFIQNEKLRAAAPLVLGVVLMSQKSETMKGVGLGMVAVGGSKLVGSFVPALNGVDDMDLAGIYLDPLAGSDDEVNDSPVSGGDMEENY